MKSPVITLNWKEKSDSVKLTSNENKTANKTKVIRQWKARYTRHEKGFIGILEFDDGSFVSVSPNGKRKYKSFQRALNFFNGSSYREKIPIQPTYEKLNSILSAIKTS